MSIETLKASLPEYAKDLKLNLSSLSAEASLTPQQLAARSWRRLWRRVTPP